MPVISSNKTTIRVRLYAVGENAVAAFANGQLYDSHGLATLESSTEPGTKVYTTIVDLNLADIKEG